MTEPQDPTSPDYYEFHYPFVLPEGQVVTLLKPEVIETLTPLEAVFIMWMMECGNGDLAINRLVHPAVPFDNTNYGAKVLLSRPHVKDTLRSLKRECPWLKLYNLDYIAGVIHGEVTFLRRENRENRFYGPNADLSRFSGKKSIHEEELAEMAMLHEYIELLVRMNETAKANAENDPAKPGDQTSSIDRVLADAQKALARREAGLDGPIRGDAS